MDHTWNDAPALDTGNLIAAVLQAVQANTGVGDLVQQLAVTYLDDNSRGQLTRLIDQPALAAPIDVDYDDAERSESKDTDDPSLIEENAALRDELSIYTAALGICPDCFDEDEDCATCDGEAPAPDAELFLDVVAPAALALPLPARRQLIRLLAGTHNSAGTDSVKPRPAAAQP